MISLNRGIAALLLLTASAQAKLMEDTVAMVNGSPIMLSEFNKELGSALEYWNRVNPGALNDAGKVKELREKTLEQLIDNELLYQQGTKLKIKVRERDIDAGVEEILRRFSRDETGRPLSEEETKAGFQRQLKKEGMSFAQFKERLGRQVMARKVIQQEVQARLRTPEEAQIKRDFEKISAFIAGSTGAFAGMDEETTQAYRDISQQIKALSSERLRVSRILIKFSPGATPKEKERALKTAKAIKKRLDASEDFGEIAKTESEDAESAAQGGDIGLVIKGMTPPEFEKALFALAVGDVSEPIETEIGYQIVRIQERHAKETPSFARFKDQLGQFLMNVGFAKETEKYVKKLKADAVVERRLPQ